MTNNCQHDYQVKNNHEDRLCYTVEPVYSDHLWAIQQWSL